MKVNFKKVNRTNNNVKSLLTKNLAEEEHLFPFSPLC